MTKWLAHTRTSLQTHIIILGKEKFSIEMIKSKKKGKWFMILDFCSQYLGEKYVFILLIYFFTVVLIFMKQWQSNSKQQFTGMVRIPKCAWSTAHVHCAARNPSISWFEKIQAISNSIDWCWNSQWRNKKTTIEPA